MNHIDTSDYYGPHVTNQIIKKALHPYPAGLVIVTKLGARRGEQLDGAALLRLMQRAVRDQRALVLLDGLDEIADSDDR